ncbi:hypothetical protein D3C86_1571590 [compost metagenome]
MGRELEVVAQHVRCHVQRRTKLQRVQQPHHHSNNHIVLAALVSRQHAFHVVAVLVQHFALEFNLALDGLHAFERSPVIDQRMHHQLIGAGGRGGGIRRLRRSG